MTRIRLFGVIPVVLVSVVLGACRAEEQGRHIIYKPGVYQGKADAALADATMDALRARALRQAGDFSQLGGGGPKQSTTADVRPPAAGGAAARLRSRLERQK